MESELATHLHDVMARNMWGVYLCLLIAPFVQEDAAVLGAASLSLAGMGETGLLFLFVTIGLSISDLWKYWLGRAALTQGWARKFAQKPAVAKAEKLVIEKLGASLMAARFVPGTRIPLYVASGYFKAPWPQFAFWIVLSAVGYIGAAFLLFHTVGAVAGEAAKIWLPVIALGALGAYLLHQAIRAKKAPSQAESR